MSAITEIKIAYNVRRYATMSVQDLSPEDEARIRDLSVNGTYADVAALLEVLDDGGKLIADGWEEDADTYFGDRYAEPSIIDYEED